MVHASPQPHDLWSAWTLAPVAAVTLTGGAVMYVRGARDLWRRAGRGRVVSVPRAWCFAGAVAATALALFSPIDTVGAALFSVHMVQHLLLMMVAAPLLVLGDPMMACLWALPVHARRAIGAWWRRSTELRALWATLTRPAIAWTAHVTVLWLWHAPALYERALLDERLHVVEHTTFFVTALLFWWPLLRSHGRRMRAPVAIAYLFAATLQGTILGAVITLARHPWYTVHYATTQPWGLSPLEDQQLAGLIMWVPAGLIYLAPVIWFVVQALSDRQKRSPLVILSAAKDLYVSS